MKLLPMNSTVLLLLATFLATSYSWDLSNLNLTDSYTVRHASVLYVRAFLCISSKSTSTMSTPTLIETTWPENLLPIQPKLFPNDQFHSRLPNDCNSIVQAVQTAIEAESSTLWVLDNGSRLCKPKLIAYNLARKNEEIHRYTFRKFHGNSFSSLKLAPKMNEIGSCRNSKRIFLTLNDEDFLVVYSMLDKSWWKLRLIVNDLIVVPNEIAFAQDGHMFISDTEHHLWLSPQSVQKCRSQTTLSTNYVEQNVTLIADLMGNAQTMVADPGDLLYYYMPRDGAVVRWNSKKSLRAENHDVLFFSSIPVVQIVFGMKGSVWVVLQTANANGDHCRRILSHFTGNFIPWSS